MIHNQAVDGFRVGNDDLLVVSIADTVSGSKYHAGKRCGLCRVGTRFSTGHVNDGNQSTFDF